jgi:hypothetical protein
MLDMIIVLPATPNSIETKREVTTKCEGLLEIQLLTLLLFLFQYRSTKKTTAQKIILKNRFAKIVIIIISL